MRIVALVKSPDHVCCRYRVAPFRWHFEALGHELEIRSWSAWWFAQQMISGFRSRPDVLIVQRKLLPWWQLQLLRRQARRLVFDFDDSIFMRSSHDPRGQNCATRFGRFRNVLQCADAVVTGNSYLRDYAKTLTDQEKIHRIPTCVDVTRYPLAEHHCDKKLVKLAWIGSSSTMRGLEDAGETLERLADHVPRLQLKVICDRSILLQRLSVEFLPWHNETEAAELADADIGISWIPDDHWSRGKCGLKVLQYMAAGLPVVANAVGIHQELVQPGVTGFLAKTPSEWEAAIRELAGNAELRRRMGLAGRRLVESEYHVSRGAAAWHSVLQRVS